VLEFSYEYMAPSYQPLVDATLNTMIQYYKELGEFGSVLQSFKFTHTEGGYTALEIFADAEAYETHARNTMAYPHMKEAMALAGMIQEKEGTIYGCAHRSLHGQLYVVGTTTRRQHFPAGTGCRQSLQSRRPSRRFTRRRSGLTPGPIQAIGAHLSSAGTRNRPPARSIPVPQVQSHRDWAHPLPHLRRDSRRSPLPHLRRDCTHPCHICTGTALTPATSAPGLHSPLPHLRRDCTHPCHIYAGPLPHPHRDWARRCHIRTGTGLAAATSAPGLGPGHSTAWLRAARRGHQPDDER
jgi:hypothetical protein